MADGKSCTCGSGADPRPCREHPGAFEAHCRELDVEGLRSTVDVLERELAEAREALTEEQECHQLTREALQASVDDYNGETAKLRAQLEAASNALIDVGTQHRSAVRERDEMRGALEKLGVIWHSYWHAPHGFRKCDREPCSWVRLALATSKGDGNAG